MTIIRLRTFTAAAALSAALIGAPWAMAAQDTAQGNTSGPASGSVTTPSAAVQKQATSQSGAAAGAPGVEAKPGTEAGGAPKAPPSKGQTRSQ